MNSFLIKIYHSYNWWKKIFKDFLLNINQTIKYRNLVFGLHFLKWELFYSLTTKGDTYPVFESQFYTFFNNFQVLPDNKNIWAYNDKNTVIWEIRLENDWFFPFKIPEDENKTEFVYNLFRTMENFDVINDRIWFFVEIEAISTESFKHYLKSLFQFWKFRIWLSLKFFKYMFNFKITSDWKSKWKEYFKNKAKSWWLFKWKLYFVIESQDRLQAAWRLKSIFNNFKILNNYPLNKFILKVRYPKSQSFYKDTINKFQKYIFSSEEISSFFNFPDNPKWESSLLKVTARRLALPIWVQIYNYKFTPNKEVIPEWYPKNVNIIWISDYRSIKVPVWILDEDRLRHLYVIGKTWVWKSKFLISLIIDDIKQWKGLWIIDPHWDLVEEAMMHIPEHRKKDVIIFDPSDEKFPFCFNPLDIKSTESKQVLAKGFIDIFKKFFWANWNPKLEHVLRMVFLALLDKKHSTLFDIVRALTDKDFRYEMIEVIKDDVVRNFWTNEFAGWSQQFNTEAIMPILNKIWQLLSIDILKNIFASTENKLDFREMMDNRKILFVKLPKWKLQEEIMWFLWAMFVTKIYQAAMWRQWATKENRIPFFLYVDEFQNFATETFNEILSEARKYWLWLAVAHQFVKQIPSNISDALFGNVWTLISFRISAEDAIFMKNHFEPYLDSYDLANLNQREFYCKMLVNWQVKDPFSLRTVYSPDPKSSQNHIANLYASSRSRYSRTLTEATKTVLESQKDVLIKISNFNDPII